MNKQVSRGREKVDRDEGFVTVEEFVSYVWTH